MYCRNCGCEVSDKAIMCVKCGTPPKAGDKFCHNCQAETDPNAIVCIKCGVSLKETKARSQQEGLDWLTTLLLCIFLGGLGIHRFYTKSIGIGIVQLLTGGGCGIWVLIDLIMIVIGSYKDGLGRELVRK